MGFRGCSRFIFGKRTVKIKRTQLPLHPVSRHWHAQPQRHKKVRPFLDAVFPFVHVVSYLPVFETERNKTTLIVYYRFNFLVLNLYRILENLFGIRYRIPQ